MEIKTTSTSKTTLTASDIILRETNTSRLIFRPQIIDNSLNQDACVRGCFISQKKGKLDNWEDYNDFPLSSLKKGEFVKLELKADIILSLLSYFEKLKELYKGHGIVYGTSIYHLTDQANIEIIDKLSNILNSPNKNEILSVIQKLDVSDLNSFTTILNIVKLKKILDIWEENKANNKEEFWHQLFIDNIWVLTQIFTAPFINIASKYYCGGKEDDNKGGIIGDFLNKNALTNNLAFIEIKTPDAKLVGNKYRGEENRENSIYSISDELTGAVNQVLNQRNTYIINYGKTKI